jgi:hypothetical protein
MLSVWKDSLIDALADDDHQFDQGETLLGLIQHLINLLE